MNKLIYLFAMILSLSLWSCGKDDDGVEDPNNPNNPGNPDNVTLELSTKDLVFEAQGGELTFDITCNADWTITNESDWCTLDMTSGNGNATVKVSTGVYEENEDRNTVLTVKAGDVSQTLTVTQKHEDALILSKDKFDVPQAGDNITIELRSNIECALTIPSRFQDWISEAPSGKGMETKTFNLTIKENEAFETREGFVIISGNELKDTVHIFQAQKDQLILTQNTYNITSEKQDILVELKTNVDYDITIPDSVSSWISLLETKASRTDRLNLSIAANEETDARSALVLIKDKNSDLADTLYINQAQKNQLILEKDTYSVNAEKQNLIIRLKTNIDYDITIPDSVSHWINLVKTKASRIDELNLSIAANEKPEARNAVVLIKDKNSSLSDTLHILQAAKDVFSLVQKEFNIKAEGKTITVELLYNTQNYNSYISSEDKKWLSIVPTTISKSLTSNKLQIIIAPNESPDSRSGKIIFYSEDYKLTDTLFINQLAQSKLILDKTEFIIQGQGDNISVKIQSNVEYEIHIAENASSWISQIQTKALIEETLNFYIAPNTTSTTRVGEIEIKDKNSSLADTIRISQGTSDTYTGDVFLSTVEKVKAFAEMGCKKIDGSLIIEGGGLTTLTQLNNQLEEIRDSLIINCRTMTNLDGLYGLKKVGGNVNIKDMGINKPVLEGLNNLETIGGNLEIHANWLSSVKGLSKLQSIGGSFRVYDGNFTSFEGLENLTSVEGDLEINNVDKISLESFKGLSGLQSIGGNFKIISNGWMELVSFEGLENLKSIGGNFEINVSDYDAWSLSSFKGLGNLASIGGNFEINAPDAFTSVTSFEGLESLASIGGNFKVSNGGLTSFKGLDKLTQIDGDFRINRVSSSSSSFEGLSSLKSIGGDFIARSYMFDGIKVENHLSNLTTVGGYMEILIVTYDRYSQETFDANFSSLESVGGSLSLNGYNDGALSLQGTLSLPLLQAIGGKCSFYGFDLIDFPNLESINGTLEIEIVNSIGTLDKLKSVGDITISSCNRLYDFCNWVPVLTDYNGTFLVTNCGYNPTKYQILNGECSQTPAN